MTTNLSKSVWKLEDHLCRACGGRILRHAGGTNIATAGGNPLYKCANCGVSASDMSPSVLCWCGFSHRGNHSTAYTCLPFSILKERPELESAFLSCGCDPKCGEVGVVLVSDLKTI